MKLNYLQQPEYIPIRYVPNYKGERTFELYRSVKVILSDGYVLDIPRGMKTDLASIPFWAWSILKPIDSAFIGDLIHDALWIDKIGQIKHFKGSLFQARKFADKERLLWRNYIAPNKKLKNYLTHFIIRVIGGAFYSRQFKIPN